MATTLKTYTLGYALSIALTLLAFGGFILHQQTGHVFPSHLELYVGFTVLAVAQLLVQLYFFLHAGKGQNRHWNLGLLAFTFFIITVLVVGTLWIMHNLKENAMQGTPFINNNVSAQYEDD